MVAGSDNAVPRGMPHRPQKAKPEGLSKLHCGQRGLSGVAHRPQTLASSEFLTPHFEQCISISPFWLRILSPFRPRIRCSSSIFDAPFPPRTSKSQVYHCRRSGLACSTGLDIDVPGLRGCFVRMSPFSTKTSKNVGFSIQGISSRPDTPYHLISSVLFAQLSTKRFNQLSLHLPLNVMRCLT